MSSAICFNLDQSKILSSGNGLRNLIQIKMNSFGKKMQKDFSITIEQELQKVMIISSSGASSDLEIRVLVRVKGTNHCRKRSKC